MIPVTNWRRARSAQGHFQLPPRLLWHHFVTPQKNSYRKMDKNNSDSAGRQGQVEYAISVEGAKAKCLISCSIINMKRL